MPVNHKKTLSAIRTIVLMSAVAFFCKPVSGQTDTEFWFALPNITSGHSHTPIMLCFASFDEATNVTVSVPSNPNFTPITINLSSFDYKTVNITQFESTLKCSPYNTVLNKGLKIESEKKISAFCQFCSLNSEIYTLKGRNALGNYFVVPTQTTRNCSGQYNPVPVNSIEIVATEDNTVVTITPSVTIYGTNSSTITVTLDAGQTYSIRSTNGQSANHLKNTIITSTKPIAVNSTDDSVEYGSGSGWSWGGGSGRDLVGDQILPVGEAGKLHVAVWSHQNYETASIFPTENNTKIYIDGSATPAATLNVGQYYTYSHSSNFSARTTVISSDKPVVVWQLTGIEKELGGTQLPAIECTGSSEVVFGRSSSSVSLYASIVTKTENTGGFILQSNNATATLAASDFSVIPSHPEWSYCYKNISSYVSNNSSLRISNSAGKFHLGILDYGGANNSTTLGYFSDYSVVGKVRLNADKTHCLHDDFIINIETEDIDSVILITPGGTYYGHTSVEITDFTSQDTGMYYAKGRSMNDCEDDLWVTDSIRITFESNPEVAVQEAYAMSFGAGASVNVTYCNTGTATLTAPYYITVFNESLGGAVLKIDTVEVSLGAGECRTEVMDFSFGGLDVETVAVSVSCAGTGIAHLGSGQKECDITNNTVTRAVAEHTASITGSHNLCDGETLTLTASEASAYLWNTGETTQSITVTSPGLYGVTVTDEHGAQDTAMHRVYKTTMAPVVKTNLHDICAGESLHITVGTDTTSTFVLEQVESTLARAETIFLPDGTNCPPMGCSYRSPLTFTGFDEGATVESVDDILYVRLNLEHSYAGDLYINITCPNGQKADILKFSGAPQSQSSVCSQNINSTSVGWNGGNSDVNAGKNTWFGYANDSESVYYNICNANAPGNEPGTGWNYCWSNCTTEGYEYAGGQGSLIYREENAVYLFNNWWYGYGHYAFDSSNVAAGTQFYHPDESFESLVGCPLNGSWYIEVMDGWEQDNGYIFEWELALAPHLVPNEYTDVTHVTVDGPWITSASSTSFMLNPPADLQNDTTVNYTFHFYDDYGCSYDSTVAIKVFSRDSIHIELSDCDNVVWNNITYTQSGVYRYNYQNSHGCDSVVVANVTIYGSAATSDSVFLVENQLPYHFQPYDTVFQAGSPEISYFSYKLYTAEGCDSVINQKVVIYQNTYQQYDTTVCGHDFPLLWHGRQFNRAGTYNDSSLNINGSTNYMVFNVLSDTVRIVSSNITHVICYGSNTGAASVVLQGGSQPYTYRWADVSGTVISTNLDIAGMSAGTYRFTVTDNLGCFDTSSITINVLNSEIDAGVIASSQDICEGEFPDIFTGTAIVGEGNYQWQVSSDTNTWQPASGANNLQNYTYSYTPSVGAFLLRRAWITPECGTYFSDTVTVSVAPVKRDTIYDDVCQDSEYNRYGFSISSQQNNNAGIYEYTETYPTARCDSTVTLFLRVNPVYSETIEDEVCKGSDYNKNGFFIPAWESIDSASMKKTLDLTSVSGCDSIVRLHLTIIDTELELINHTANFCEEHSALLSVETSMGSLLWSTGETDKQITVTKPGTYSVTASEGSCEATATTFIENCDWNLFLPSAITPGKDGLNDCFAIPEQIQNEISALEVYIYNRWGGVVFYSKDKGFRWDGKVDGKIVPSAVYVYTITYRDLKGIRRVARGTLTVL